MKRDARIYNESLIDARGVVWQVHSRQICKGPCTFHRASNHNMLDLPILIRETGLVERICEHGVGHPDPDSMRYLNKHSAPGARGAWGVHGCCGCCAKRRAP